MSRKELRDLQKGAAYFVQPRPVSMGEFYADNNVNYDIFSQLPARSRASKAPRSRSSSPKQKKSKTAKKALKTVKKSSKASKTVKKSSKASKASKAARNSAYPAHFTADDLAAIRALQELGMAEDISNNVYSFRFRA